MGFRYLGNDASFYKNDASFYKNVRYLARYKIA